MRKDLLASIPKVDKLINDVNIKNKLEIYPRKIILDTIREEIELLRKEILSLDDRDLNDFTFDYDELVDSIVDKVKNKYRMSLRKVINATGVVLHTNLGRAVISKDIIEYLADVACNYSTLEYDINTGSRGTRYSHVESLITYLTGAEAAMVVNNNAAAVLLVLNTLAKNKEVIVSRGELVEIGGSFRIPEVIRESGAILVEVGTTNKTHYEDYENHINENTAAILKVHTSNYKIVGFTKELSVEELVPLAKKHDIPLIQDLGSGTLIDFSKYGISSEPTVQDSIRFGADIVTFSGDKLLGGPQAGIIIGKKHLIDEIKKNQLTRALRVDKMTLVVLEATLRKYIHEEEETVKAIPTLRMLTIDIKDLEKKAEKFLEHLESSSINLKYEIIKDYSQVGGGAMPLSQLPTYAVAIEDENLTVNALEEMLRQNEIPIITRIKDNKVLFDVRTIDEEDFSVIINALKGIKGEKDFE